MKLKLKNVRLAFPSLFQTAVPFAGSTSAPKFQAAFIFPPDHPAKKMVEDACLQVAKDKWGAKGAAVHAQLAAADKLAIHDGDLKADYEGYPGNFFVNASNATKPTVRDVDGVTELSAQDGKPYAGCYVVALIEIWAQDHKQFGKRVNASLRGVQFYKDGDAFSGSPPADDEEFDDLESGDDDNDMMG